MTMPDRFCPIVKEWHGAIVSWELLGLYVSGAVLLTVPSIDRAPLLRLDEPNHGTHGQRCTTSLTSVPPHASRLSSKPAFGIHWEELAAVARDHHRLLTLSRISDNAVVTCPMYPWRVQSCVQHLVQAVDRHAALVRLIPTTQSVGRTERSTGLRFERCQRGMQTYSRWDSLLTSLYLV